MTIGRRSLGLAVLVASFSTSVLLVIAARRRITKPIEAEPIQRLEGVVAMPNPKIYQLGIQEGERRARRRPSREE